MTVVYSPPLLTCQTVYKKYLPLLHHLSLCFNKYKPQLLKHFYSFGYSLTFGSNLQNTQKHIHNKQHRWVEKRNRHCAVSPRGPPHLLLCLACATSLRRLFIASDILYTAFLWRQYFQPINDLLSALKGWWPGFIILWLNPHHQFFVPPQLPYTWATDGTSGVRNPAKTWLCTYRALDVERFKI